MVEIPTCLWQNGKTKRIEILKYIKEILTCLWQNVKISSTIFFMYCRFDRFLLGNEISLKYGFHNKYGYYYDFNDYINASLTK